MSSDEENVEQRKRKKGVVNTDKYKRNAIKKAKITGAEHINWAGRLIPAKQPGSTSCG